MKEYHLPFESLSTGIISKSIKQFVQPLFLMTISLSFILLLSCSSDDADNEFSEYELAKISFESLKDEPGNMIVAFPSEDPGIPIYARVGPILNQYFISDDQLIIPFYRMPACIPDTFNLLNYYDPPTAFQCDLSVSGRFVIEEDAEAGQFPIMAHTTGTNVPLWIVSWSSFQSAMNEGAVTIRDVENMNPIIANAIEFEEYLSPRMNEHQVIIKAEGTIPDQSQTFTLNLVHKGDEIKRIEFYIE